AGLIQGLRQTAEVMKAVQLNYAEAGIRLQDTIKSLGERVDATVDDVGHIKQILRDGFRLPNGEG
ncbi:MAG: hypothetical protein PVJ15_06345, partial [Gammaproteobacteria bacterium]